MSLKKQRQSAGESPGLVSDSCLLLNSCLRRDANSQLLTLWQTKIFAAGSEHAGCADRATDCCSNRRSFAAADNRANDRANTGRGADFRNVILGRTFSLHSAFRINGAGFIVSLARAHDFNHLSTHAAGAIVRRANGFECQLKFRTAFEFSCALNSDYASLDDGPFEFPWIQITRAWNRSPC